jgi:cysteine sulfinate desulfinase/cysteine desulfurase-like protein
MYRLNTLQYPLIHSQTLDESQSLQPLKSNDVYEQQVKTFCSKFNFSALHTFSFTIEGLMGFMMNLEAEITISLGESQAIIYAGKRLKSLGMKVNFLELNHDGSVNLEALKECSSQYIFISSYVMDTFVKTPLQEVKSLTDAKIISNMSATQEEIAFCDVALFDAYKLTGFQSHSVALHQGILPEQYLAEVDFVGVCNISMALEIQSQECAYKEAMMEALKKELKEDIFFFVSPQDTLNNSLHFGLKDIKAREIIRTLSLSGIFVTNGEGCSLGLSRPSRIIQAMGYSELESRQALSFSLTQELNEEAIEHIAKTLAKKYRQIKALNE